MQTPRGVSFLLRTKRKLVRRSEESQDLRGLPAPLVHRKAGKGVEMNKSYTFAAKLSAACKSQPNCLACIFRASDPDFCPPTVPTTSPKAKRRPTRSVIKSPFVRSIFDGLPAAFSLLPQNRREEAIARDYLLKLGEIVIKFAEESRKSRKATRRAK